MLGIKQLLTRLARKHLLGEPELTRAAEATTSRFHGADQLSPFAHAVSYWIEWFGMPAESERDLRALMEQLRSHEESPASEGECLIADIIAQIRDGTDEDKHGGNSKMTTDTVLLALFLVLALGFLLWMREWRSAEPRGRSSEKGARTGAGSRSAVPRNWMAAIVVQAGHEQLIELLRQRRHLDPELSKELRSVGQWLWYGTEAEWQSKDLEPWFHDASTPRAEGEYDIYLIAVTIGDQTLELGPDSSPLARRDALAVLATRHAPMRVSARLPKEAIEHKGFFRM